MKISLPNNVKIHQASIPFHSNTNSLSNSKSIQGYNFPDSIIHEDSISSLSNTLSNNLEESWLRLCTNNEPKPITPIPKEENEINASNTSFMTTSFYIEIEAGIMVSECKGLIRKLNEKLDDNYVKISRESLENIRLKQTVHNLQDRIGEKKKIEISFTRASCGCLII
ncbi:hypothetical protein SteCoe_3689 [Stentor coeruleus]|uniref:Uncharacterized protein n=1 Tax=Stentor coeruleus TaxID=5963 RepID=A0A1R2CWG6_9CILI|nr:hypothetical protein SteCoe_3689 [Stentor coeruleus]